MTLQEKMLAVMADVNDHIMEREELVELIAIALLTRKNLFVLGEPGQAKSYDFENRPTGRGSEAPLAEANIFKYHTALA